MAVKTLEASSDLCHQKKKIQVLLCSLKSLRNVALVLFPLKSDLYKQWTVTFLAPLPPSMAPLFTFIARDVGSSLRELPSRILGQSGSRRRCSAGIKPNAAQDHAGGSGGAPVFTNSRFHEQYWDRWGAVYLPGCSCCVCLEAGLF